jgi:hypothetical protein
MGRFLPLKAKFLNIWLVPKAEAQAVPTSVSFGENSLLRIGNQRREATRYSRHSIRHNI